MRQSNARPPSRVLIVEDTHERQQVLKSLYRREAWVLVHTGARAVTLLSAFSFDIVSLDYNLAGELTGADVARAIARVEPAIHRVVVHSLNPQGVREIRSILPTAIVYPVSRIVRSNAAFKRLRAGIEAFGPAYTFDD